MNDDATVAPVPAASTSTTPVDPGTVALDYAAWAAAYPELAPSVPEAQARAYWERAGLYLDNTGASPVREPARRALLLGLLTAHIAATNATINGEAPSPLVGRIASATEGSVSVSTDLGGLPGSAAWFVTSRYGYAFWEATRALRTFRYVPGPRAAAPYIRPGAPFGLGV